MARHMVRGIPLALLVAWALRPGQSLQGQPSGAPAPADQEAARKLVEHERSFQQLVGEKGSDFLAGGKPRGAAPADRVYLTRAEYAAPKEELEKPRGRGAPRTVILTYYRYKTDAAIVSVVDLSTKKVLKVDQFPHLPTPLAKEELQEARELAENNGEVHKLLQRYAGQAVEFSPLVVAAGEKDPAFGHRLVVFSLRVGKDYLLSPRIQVDLTEGKVKVDAVALPTGMKMAH